MKTLVDELYTQAEGPLPSDRASSRFPECSRDWSDAFDGTIQPFVGLMLSLARGILGDEPQAWDAVQEALIALWVKGEKPTNPRAWLTSAVILRSLHLTRSRARRRRHERRACQRKPEASTRDAPTRRIEHAELSRVVDEAFLSLPSAYREVFLLRTAARMDYAEISEVMNLPIGTVRSRLNRTRRMIQSSIARKLPGDD